MLPPANPRISIISATYNRSNVLIHTIESVRRSTFADGELVVIGDACTDDTTEVVAGFNAPRIRLTNLEHNFGEQSGPNIPGAEMARARYLAFLNHDDLFFPEHLERSLAHLETTQADLVFAGVACSWGWAAFASCCTTAAETRPPSAW